MSPSVSPPVRCARFRAGAWLAFAGTIAALAMPSRAVEFVPTFGQRDWHQADGLPSNEVTALCQDRGGYLWVATPAGLARFDGTRFVRFDYVPATLEAEPGFTSLAADPTRDGLLAAPRSGGVVRLRGGRFEPLTLPAPVAAAVATNLLVAPDGARWLAFKDGRVLRQHGGRDELFGPPHGLDAENPVHFAHDGAGRVWLSSGTLLARYENGALVAMPPAPHSDELRVASARRDGPWVVMRGRLMKVIGGDLTEVVKINANFNARSVQACLEDESGALWLGSRSRGLRRVTVSDGDSRLAVRVPEDISALVEDASGSLWAGSNGGGLVRVRPGVLRRYDKVYGLLENHSLTVCQDRAGTIWFANRDGGVAFINELGRVLTLDPLPVRDTFSVLSVAPAPNSGVWATSSHGLLRAELKRVRAATELGVPAPPESGEVRVSFTAKNGDLWLALGPARVGRLRDGAWTQFGAAEGLGPGAIEAIAEDSAGRIWLGGEETWVSRLDGERFARVPLSASKAAGAIQAIHFDAAGTCWLGTEAGGLIRLDAGGGRALDARHGLPANNLTQLLGDDQGVFWFGSPDAIFHLRRDELEEFFAGQRARVEPVIVGLDEGLTETTCLASYQPSAWKSTDGTLWFATRQGVVAIDPRAEQADRTPLGVKIEVAPGEGVTATAAGVVRVAPGTHTVELNYSVLCLATPERVRARLHLQGYDDNWTPAPASGAAKYTRLPPGMYRFEVAAFLAGVPRSDASAMLDLVVEAAWWQTWWFRIGAAAAGLAAIVGAARLWSHRRLRARLVQLEHAAALEQERARIAQNIHDELGAGLTRISLLTQFADERDGRAQLDKIYDTVSGLTQSMDEIVWAVNPKHDDLEGLANYLAEFAQSFLTDAGLRCRVLLPDFLPAHGLTTQFRHHLFLSCKEALNNVVKHARATEVSVRLGVEGDRLTITITDDGRGFAVATATSGNGLANLCARLAALGGRCDVASSAAGTVVTFTAPLAPPTPSSS